MNRIEKKNSGKNPSSSTSQKSGLQMHQQEEPVLQPEDLNYFRSFLLSQKSSLLNRSMEFQKLQRQGRMYTSEEAENASNDLAENVSFHLIERDHALLFQIENALSRLSSGTFGQCESCAVQISPRRLKISPFSTLCVDCTEEKEDSKH